MKRNLIKKNTNITILKCEQVYLGGKHVIQAPDALKQTVKLEMKLKQGSEIDKFEQEEASVKVMEEEITLEVKNEIVYRSGVQEDVTEGGFIINDSNVIAALAKFLQKVEQTPELRLTLFSNTPTTEMKEDSDTKKNFSKLVTTEFFENIGTDYAEHLRTGLQLLMQITDQHDEKLFLPETQKVIFQKIQALNKTPQAREDLCAEINRVYNSRKQVLLTLFTFITLYYQRYFYV